MNSGLYRSITEKEVPYRSPGYTKAWFSLVEDIEKMQLPMLSSNPIIGDAYTISESHLWKTGKEPIRLLIKQDSIEVDSESVGDIGGARIIWRPKLMIQGDGAEVDELIHNLLNEEYVLFVLDGTGNGNFIQYGNASLPCNTEKASLKSGNLMGGGKGTSIEGRALCKFFYKGIIPAEDALYDITFGALVDFNFEFMLDSDGGFINF